MWKKVDAFVRKNRMIEDGDCVLVGLSGGADSVCLLRYLLAAQEKLHIKIRALHVNHLLRGAEAERDERFAEELCKRWEVPFAAVQEDVEKERKRRRCSLEEAGRLVRYACFDTFAKEWGCNRIAVAHHKNDLAETVLFRMARGTGVRGLAGIRPVTGNLIRPLLCLEKREIADILAALGQPFVEDSSNREDAYSRNHIRLHLLPEMEKLNAQAVEHLGQIAGQAAALTDYLEPLFQKLYRENVRRRENALLLPADAVRQMHPVEQSEVARRMLTELSGVSRDISSLHVEQLLRLFGKKEGKYQEFPHGLTAERVREGVLLGRREAHLPKKAGQAEEIPLIRWVDMERLEKTGSWETEIAGSGRFHFSLEVFHGGDIEKNDCVKYFDYDKIKRTLCLRYRRTGDYLVVDKEGRHKPLRRYFIDEKVPAGQRGARLLLAEDAHILWVTGGRISEAYRVTPDTGRMLVVRAEDK